MEIKKHLRVKNRVVREMLGEFIGTFILVSFCIASGAQYVLSRGALSSFLTVNFAGGMGLTFGIYWAGAASGASLNPAVTLAFCLQGVIEWWQFFHYVVAEFFGAFAAAAVQFGVYYDAINAYDGGQRQTHGDNKTAGIFSTFPNDDVSTLTCFFDQVWGTFILVSCILAVTDGRGWKPEKGLLPLALGAIVFAIGTCWAHNCGYPLNPARDLSPRIFTAIAGWGTEPFSYRNYNWFWVPIIGPMVGAVLAWALYNGFIALHHPDEEVDDNALNQSLDVTASATKNGRQNGRGAVNHAFTADGDVFSIEARHKTHL